MCQITLSLHEVDPAKICDIVKAAGLSPCTCTPAPEIVEEPKPEPEKPADAPAEPAQAPAPAGVPEPSTV